MYKSYGNMNNPLMIVPFELYEIIHVHVQCTLQAMHNINLLKDISSRICIASRVDKLTQGYRKEFWNLASREDKKCANAAKLTPLSEDFTVAERKTNSLLSVAHYGINCILLQYSILNLYWNEIVNKAYHYRRREHF